MTFIFFQQKTAYEMRISDWSSDVCSSDLWKSSLRWPAGLPVHDCPPPKAALASRLKAYVPVEGGNYGHLLLQQQAESDDTLLSALRPEFESAHPGRNSAAPRPSGLLTPATPPPPPPLTSPPLRPTKH